MIRGDYELATAFATLYWPEFVEVDDCVLLKENFIRTSFEEWRDAFQGDRARIEAMINHTQVWDLFPNAEDDHLDEKVFVFIGRTLESCWTAALRAGYPHRTFVVEYADEPDEYGPTVTFWQESK
jgi:hypothetical protein